jgi:signal transduction histidine kinase
VRRRISWLVAATTSAVILAFVVPLCLLVRDVAADRALAQADQEARAVALLVSSLSEDPRLESLVAAADERTPAPTSVLTPDGDVLGAAARDLARDPGVRRALGGTAFTERDSAGARVYVPVVVPDGQFVVRTTVDDALLSRGVGRAWLIISALGAVFIGLAMLFADRLGRHVSTPVTDLAAVAHRLRDGDLDARAARSGPPETVELADALNQLADRIEELLVAERAHVGDLSHRLRTPVTALRLDADAVTDPVLSVRLQSHLAHLQRTVDAIVRDARRPLRHSLRASCDLRQVTQERMAFWAALAEDQERRLRVELPPAPVRVALDAADVMDVIDVLVDNVFAHTAEGAGFAVRLWVREGHAVLDVSDDGPGISTEEPSEVRVGSTGLGLQIARRTVGAVGGDVAVTTSATGGTTVQVTLPVLG